MANKPTAQELLDDISDEDSLIDFFTSDPTTLTDDDLRRLIDINRRQAATIENGE